MTHSSVASTVVKLTQQVAVSTSFDAMVGPLREVKECLVVGEEVATDVALVAFARWCVAIANLGTPARYHRTVVDVATVAVKTCSLLWIEPPVPAATKLTALSNGVDALLAQLASPKQQLTTLSLTSFLDMLRGAAASASKEPIAAATDGILQLVEIVASLVATVPNEVMALRSPATGPTALIDMARQCRALQSRMQLNAFVGLEEATPPSPSQQESEPSRSKTDTVLAELIKAQEESDAARQQALDAAKDNQQAQLDAALAAKRNRRMARGAGLTATATPPPNTEGTPGGEVQLALERWMVASRILTGAVQNVRLSSGSIRRGCLDNAARIHISLSTIYTCAVNGANRIGDNVAECFMSSCALDARLSSLLPLVQGAAQQKDQSKAAVVTSELEEWADLALNLADVYLASFHDVSQAEHLVACVDYITTQLFHPTAETALLLAFNKACIATHLVKVVGRAFAANADATMVALFANAVYPPEHMQAADAAAIRDTAAWASHSERVAMQAVSPQLVAAPRLVVPCPSGRNDLAKLYDAALIVLSACDQMVTVDTDCEKAVRLLRMRADCEGTLLSALGDTAAGNRRLECLGSIKRLGLDSRVFSNVLRQADFEAGTTHVALAEDATAKKQHESVAPHYEAALEHFSLFCQAFRDVDKAAARERIPPPFEESDASAYLLGASRQGDVLLKLSRRNDALRWYQETLLFLNRICAAAKITKLPEHTQAVKGLMEQMIQTLSNDNKRTASKLGGSA